MRASEAMKVLGLQMNAIPGWSKDARGRVVVTHRDGARLTVSPTVSPGRVATIRAWLDR